jgi:hypothetical protein
MRTFRVMTSTVSFGQRVFHRLDTIVASDVASAERIAARLHPIVTGYRAPWVEEIAWDGKVFS